MEFVAIDVETANADMASICQVGLARFCGHTLVEEWSTYIDPEDYFDPVNVSIHGITSDMVKGSPTFLEVAEKLSKWIAGAVSVCHTHFDRVAVHQVFEKYDLECPGCCWLDSARVARRTWEQCTKRGYGLHDVCQIIGYDFKHHDALEDAKAAGKVLLAAIEKTGLDLQGWLKRVNLPVDPKAAASRGKIERAGNSDGYLYGEVLVFTGALEIPRKQAADMAALVGCEVAPGVTKKTTILVVGDQDIDKLGGHEKSSKHRKVEELIRAGQAIRIIRETDFKKLVQVATESPARVAAVEIA